MLDRILAEVDFAGPLGPEVILHLHQAGVPISFISASSGDPEIQVHSSEPVTVRVLLDEVLEQATSHRLAVVGGKLVMYPLDAGFDALVDLGDVREEKRAGAWTTVIRSFDTASRPELRDIGTVFRGSSLSFGDASAANSVWQDSISIGGVRRAVEHLVSLIAGSPSATFTVLPGRNGRRYLSLSQANVVEKLLLETPRRVEVGEEFQIVPRAVLAGGQELTLIGPACGVTYQTLDDSIRIDGKGSAVALVEGTSGIFASYEANGASVEIEVTDE